MLCSSPPRRQGGRRFHSFVDDSRRTDGKFGSFLVHPLGTGFSLFRVPLPSRIVGKDSSFTYSFTSESRQRVVQKCVHLVIEAASFRLFCIPRIRFTFSLSDRACWIERGTATDRRGFTFEIFIICAAFAEDCARNLGRFVDHDEAPHAQHAGVQHQGRDERLSPAHRGHEIGDQRVGDESGVFETYFSQAGLEGASRGRTQFGPE